MRRRQTLALLAALPVAALAGCDGTKPAAGPGGEPGGGSEPPVTAPPAAPAGQLPGSVKKGTTPPVVNNGPRDGSMVALTFDADLTAYMKTQLDTGQVATYHNEALLSYLEREKVAATFFMTGMWATEYADVAKRIAGNPIFELANHSYEHKAFTDKCYGLDFEDDPKAMAADVERTFGVLEPLGGNQTRFFRYPGLCHDKRALEALAPLGVTVVDGDVVSGDPFAEASQPIVDAVLGKAKPGSIVIMHIGGPNAPQTHKALPKIVEGLREKGMTFGRLSEVVPPAVYDKSVPG